MITFKYLGDVYSFGYLGNQMFQIASTIGIALKSDPNQKATFPNWNYSKYFKKPLPNLTNDFSKYENFNENGRLGYIDFKLTGDWNLLGYFQSFKYFDDFRDIILSYFEPNDELLSSISKKYPILFDKNVKTCSIHMRLGDYRNFPNAHPILQDSYFLEAYNKIDDKENTIFFVCSNEISHAKAVLTKFIPSENLIFSENNLDIFDMVAMSLCQDNIIANSSFSWWSAYMNKNEHKKVIAPLNWFGPQYGNESINDRLKEEWIKI